MIGGVLGKVIEEFSDELVNKYGDEIKQAAEKHERLKPDANKDLWVCRRFVRAVLRDLLDAIGLW